MSATGLGAARKLLVTARAELAAEHWDAAVTKAREALAAAPTEREATVQAALVLLDAGEATSAIPVLEEAVQANPRNAAYPVFLGLACMDAGLHEKARAMFDHALEMQPENLLAAGFRIVLALREQETGRALDLLKSVGVEASSRLTGRLLMEVEHTVRRLEGHAPKAPEPASDSDGAPSGEPGSAPGVVGSVDDSPREPCAAGPTDGSVPGQATAPGAPSDGSPAPAATPAGPAEAPASSTTPVPAQSAATPAGPAEAPASSTTPVPAQSAATPADPAEALASTTTSTPGQPAATPADPAEALASTTTPVPGQPPTADEAPKPLAAKPPPAGLLSQMVDPFVSQYLLWRAERALVGSRLEEATSLAREAVERSRESPRALSTLGMCLLQVHRAEEALEIVAEAAKVDGETPDVLYLKGCCLQELGRLPEARETLQKMLAGFAKDAPAIYTLGQIELQEGNLLLARRYFEQSANLDFLVVRERLDHLRRLVEQGPPPSEGSSPASAATATSDVPAASPPS